MVRFSYATVATAAVLAGVCLTGADGHEAIRGAIAEVSLMRRTRLRCNRDE